MIVKAVNSDDLFSLIQFRAEDEPNQSSRARDQGEAETDGTTASGS